MQNIGEEIAGQYLKYCRYCEFIDYNLQTVETQGEIDVVGINAKLKEIYLCEVATHLETGLQYTSNARPDNVERFIKKFSKDIEYAKKYFPDYRIHVMLWSPIVKRGKDNAKNDQARDVRQVLDEIEKKYGIEVEAVINQNFLDKLQELRDIAAEKTEELKSPVMRYLQIEEKLIRHIERQNRKQPG